MVQGCEQKDSNHLVQGSEQKDNAHKLWAGEKKPSMKRRCEERDYTERGIYLITIAIEGRRPLLGTLAGDAAISSGPEAPHVVLSPLGEQVKLCWLAIARYYPQVESMKLCIMPDHLHGILFVHQRIERHLGHVINSFKAGTRKAARQLGLLPASPVRYAEPQPPVKYTEALPQPTQQPRPTQQPQPTHQPTRPKHAAIGTLWESGYNDRLLLRKGQLQRMLSYLDDNPRRLLLKRQHRQYFTQLGPLNVVGVPMQAMGNPTLLAANSLLQVQCSRHLYPNEIEQRKKYFLEAGKQGAVIVSPCISPGEQQIATACMSAGIPLIVLLLKGFPLSSNRSRAILKPVRRASCSCCRPTLGRTRN